MRPEVSAAPVDTALLDAHLAGWDYTDAYDVMVDGDGPESALAAIRCLSGPAPARLLLRARGGGEHCRSEARRNRSGGAVPRRLPTFRATWETCALADSGHFPTFAAANNALGRDVDIHLVTKAPQLNLQLLRVLHAVWT